MGDTDIESVRKLRETHNKNVAEMDQAFLKGEEVTSGMFDLLNETEKHVIRAEELVGLAWDPINRKYIDTDGVK